MKILITTDVFPPGSGGSGQSAAALSRALARRGHEVTVVIAREGTDGDAVESRREGLRVLEVGRARLADFLRGGGAGDGYDLAHAQHRASAEATVRAASRIGYPVVVTVRDYWPVCIWSTRLSGTHRCPGCSFTRRVLCAGRRHPSLWPISPLVPPLIGRAMRRRGGALSRAAAVVAVSEWVASTVAAPRTVVIPNLLDLASLDRALSGPLPPGLPERFVLFAGKLEPNKAPDLAPHIVRASAVDVPLVFAGKGSLEERLRGERGVVLLGWTDEETTLRLMRRAAAVLFPSRWDEPLSRVLLEGLGVGAALVVQPTGGTPEIVEDSTSALTGGSVEAMGRALRRVLTDPELAARLRHGARRRAEERFSEAAVLPRVEALYERVVAEHRA